MDDETGRGNRARTELAATRFADVRWVGETGSTNADVTELARQGAAEGVVVVADHQSAGRGRRGRHWEAPPNASLMMSVLLRPPAAALGVSVMVVGLAAVEAVEALTGHAPRLKWPNDIVWSGSAGSAGSAGSGVSPGVGAGGASGADRKLAGILAEVDWPSSSGIAGGWSRPGPSERLSVVVGLGLNVDWNGPMPGELGATAVALDEITAPHPPPDREDLLIEILRRLDSLVPLLSQGGEGRAEVHERWRARSATLGQRVRVDLGSDDVEGTAVDITADGHLVVETLEGQRRVLAVGDVVHLRPVVDGAD